MIRHGQWAIIVVGNASNLHQINYRHGLAIAPNLINRYILGVFNHGIQGEISVAMEVDWSVKKHYTLEWRWWQVVEPTDQLSMASKMGFYATNCIYLVSYIVLWENFLQVLVWFLKNPIKETGQVKRTLTQVNSRSDVGNNWLEWKVFVFVSIENSLHILLEVTWMAMENCRQRMVKSSSQVFQHRSILCHGMWC